jgi:hypothetical protein
VDRWREILKAARILWISNLKRHREESILRTLRQAPRGYARDTQGRQAPRDPSINSGQARPGQAGQVEHGEKIEGASG